MNGQPLSRAYACQTPAGGPILTAVDPAIFRLRYFGACMACGFCADSCCRYGVDIDMANVGRLKALPADFRARVGVDEADWFDGPVRTDGEFPSGQHMRTAVRQGACVFLNRQGRGCLIHAYCLARGLDYHLLKPLVSILFPLTFEHGVLLAADEARDASLVCAGQGPSCYEGAREELAYYFGSALVAELDGLAEKSSTAHA